MKVLRWKNIKRELNRSTETQEDLRKFKLMCDKSANGIIIVENDKITYLNDSVSEIFDLTKKEIVKLAGMELAIPEDDNEALLQFIKEEEKTGIPPNIIEFWINLKDGKKKCIQNRYFTAYDEKKIIRFITITDITDMKLKIEKLKENRNNLQKLVKMLGVENDLNKNFEYEDLLAILNVKPTQNEKIESIEKDITQNTYTFKIKISPSISEEEKNLVFLTLFLWDKKFGPVLNKIYPIEENPPFSSEDIGIQLFHSAVSIYGQKILGKGQGVLLEIENIKKYGYIFFDIMPGEEFEYNRFMIALISPKINYFESLKIKKIFEEVANKIKENEDWNIKEYWEKVLNILLTPQL